MTPPLLKLAFVQGPRDGESLEYKPGSTIRIGRVVRGNEIAIKDAGISTKHLRIVSDSENWIIHDLGSSNGTILNSETLDPDTPVNLGHGDVIKLGEYTSIVVNFETVVQAHEEEEEEEEQKLPPRPRRNNRRLPVPDPVQEKPKRRGRPRKNETKEAVPVEKKAQGGKKNAEDVHNLGLNAVKVEIEDTPKGVEISAVKRGTRSSRQIRNVKCEDDVIEEEKRRPSRATRSTKKEVGGDSFQELERVLNQARKSRANKKKVEQKPSKSAVEEMDEDVEEDKESEKDVGEGKGCSETSDKENESVEQVEIESRKSTMVGEEDLDCSVREDGETENFQEERDSKGEEGGIETSKMVEQVEIKSRNSAVVGEEDLSYSVREDGVTENLQEEKDSKGEEGRVETSDGKAEQGSRNEKNVEKVDLEKMTLGDWFEYMKVHLRKQIVDETEKLIEDMRSKSLKVRHHIAEQKQAKGKGRSSLV